MEKIAHYQLVRSLGKGGMGEVFLAHDLVCDRELALKKIRPDLLKHTIMKERFLREARIAAQLAHPSIIPIYEIIQGKDQIYYTMPYVQGETLKEILKTSKEQEKKGEILHPIGSSIPELIRIFLSICQAIHYAHSRKILHRDIKPENILLGKYGEVLIFDWGLADFFDHLDAESSIANGDNFELTRPGKIVGTLGYLPPERALGESADITTDVYALGVILYQILTLQMPFQRASLETFRRHMSFERLLEPEEVAPNRDIPRQLADMAKKCLAPSKKERYSSVEALISDLKNYIEGRPEWIRMGSLSFSQKKDWAFSENILLAKYIAITRGMDITEWVNVRISKHSFSESTKIETEVILGSKGQGIGFLMSIPEPHPTGLEKCYFLWLGEEGSKLLLRDVEVMPLPDVRLIRGKRHAIRIEKTEQNFRFYLDGELKCNFLTHIPTTGTYLGLLLKDDALQINEITVFAGSLNATVNCLAIPDAFLTYGDFLKALTEYRRIAEAFSGRAEGREALFRAGITLLEKAKKENKKSSKQKLLSASLEEFSKLRGTPGGLLEFLGKSLVYQSCEDLEEEIKCLEIALRKFRKAPLFSLLSEHIVFRLHETAAQNRKAAYTFALLAIRHIPEVFSNPDNADLLKNLTTHLEPLPFLKPTHTHQDLAITLAFWLAKPLLIDELLDQGRLSEPERENAFYCLLELGSFSLLKKHKNLPFPRALISSEKKLMALTQSSSRAKTYLCQIALDQNKPEFAISNAEGYQLIWAYLLQKNWKEAEQLFASYPKEQLLQENSPLFFLFGCYLCATKGKNAALSHFKEAAENPFPPTPVLLAAYLMKKISINPPLFFWERKQLYRELTLFYRCAKDERHARLFQRKNAAIHIRNYL